MTVAEAAKQLEVSPRTVYQLCAEGLLSHIRIGVGRGAIRIGQDDIDAFRERARAKSLERRPAPVVPYALKHIKSRTR